MLIRSLVCAVAFLNFPLAILTADDNEVGAAKSASKSGKKKPNLKCPEPESIPFDFFPLPCVSNTECRLMGTGYLCCGREGSLFRCTKGVKADKKSKSNQRITLPVVQSASANQVAVKAVPTTKVTTTTTTTVKPTTKTTTKKPTTKASTKVTTAKAAKVTAKPKGKSSGDLVCPSEKDVPFQFLVIRCLKSHNECKKSLGADFLCCNKRCLRGVTAPITEQDHEPILGVIPRECPSEPFGELLFDTPSCETDAECWPRVCCPDGKQRYCRTAVPRFDLVPATKNLNNPLNAMASYLQCSSPPPKGLDLFPKICNTSIDCFPNLCCHEAGKKYCRPAKKSILALIAGVSQRVSNSIASFRDNRLRTS